MNLRSFTTLAAPLLLLALVACDDHDDMHHRDDHGACDTMADGPSLAVAAAAPGTAAAPAVSSDHKRYDLTLPVGEPMVGMGSGEGSGDGSGDGSRLGSGVGERGFDGIVSLPIAEAGDYTLFFDKDAQVGLFAADGTEVALGSMQMPVSDCSDTIFHGLNYTLAVGTYTLRLGSSLSENLRLVIVAASDAADHRR